MATARRVASLYSLLTSMLQFSCNAQVPRIAQADKQQYILGMQYSIDFFFGQSFLIQLYPF